MRTPTPPPHINHHSHNHSHPHHNPNHQHPEDQDIRHTAQGRGDLDDGGMNEGDEFFVEKIINKRILQVIY